MSEREKDGGSDKGPCPECQHSISRVVDSRLTERRRECRNCGTQWVTEEIFKRIIKVGEIPTSSAVDPT